MVKLTSIISFVSFFIYFLNLKGNQLFTANNISRGGKKMKRIKSKRKRIKRYKFIQILFILPIIICALITSNKVSAGTQDSNLVRNQINGIYAVAPLSDRTHLYNLEIYKVNNKVSYCIEIGKPVRMIVQHLRNPDVYITFTSVDNGKYVPQFNESLRKNLEYIDALLYQYSTFH